MSKKKLIFICIIALLNFYFLESSQDVTQYNFDEGTKMSERVKDPDFIDTLASSEKPTIEYRGRIVGAYHDFSIGDAFKFRITFGGSNSEWKQGIRLDASGVFVFEGQEYSNSLIIWEREPMSYVDIAFYNDPSRTNQYPIKLPPNGFFRIRNVWEDDQGNLQFNQGAAAMVITSIETGVQYNCNDGHLDEDFNDLIFAIEPFVWEERRPRQ